MHEVTKSPEKAIAISIADKSGERERNLEYLDELCFLAETAGAEIVEKIYQELSKPNPKTLIGKGKREELKLMIMEHDCTLVIFDNDLSPAQMRNLENSLNVKVMDRSGIILDIFADRAKTTEAKTQVELAQLQYFLPRLTRLWTHLSKQYGGIGTKGPGETQIETDRRMIRTRIQKLKEKLEDIDMQKHQQRKSRENLPRYALVGYTNAGKSTLMNVITEAKVYIEDKLFATLDTTVRAFDLPDGQKALLSDTVGFIRKLPTHLVASFRSTLAEASEADFIIHVIDISQENFEDQIKVVNETLESLEIDNKPIIHVFNKVDLIEDQFLMARIEDIYDNAVFISARQGINISALNDKFQELYDVNTKKFNLLLPYTKMDLMPKLYNTAEILERKDTDDGIELIIKLEKDKEEHFNFYFNEYVK